MSRKNTNINEKVFPERLKKIREKNGHLSQRQAAERINISPSAWSQWESGKHVPDMIEVQTIAYAFNVSVGYLTGETRQSDPDDSTLHFETLGEFDRSTIIDYMSLDKVDRDFVNRTVSFLKSRKYTKK